MGQILLLIHSHAHTTVLVQAVEDVPLCAGQEAMEWRGTSLQGYHPDGLLHLEVHYCYILGEHDEQTMTHGRGKYQLH